ncbi:MAG: outer membrane receptor protein involved in Fe transport [Paraglaciecola psychrophila]|jgi:outer membrane receptor protein involved in Fe transport
MVSILTKNVLTLLVVSLALAPLSTVAQESGIAQTSMIEETLFFGRAAHQIGEAGAASEGSVGGADLAIRPLLQVAELLEAVPGMVAVQHSGSGKANQYFMRGFNLDHGTDFTNSIDSVPINLRSHGHGRGYLDVNGLIPETVERIDYSKGTYSASSGDFSMAGRSQMHSIDRFEESFISAEGGSNGWQRLAVGSSVAVADGTLTGIIQHKAYHGPWQSEEDLDHKSLWIKYIKDLELGTLSASLSGYSARWSPTEQIPESAIATTATVPAQGIDIGDVVCKNAYCSLFEAEGKTDRVIATLQLDADSWHGALYLQSYDWEMSSNPTYDAPLNQFDKRTIIGGHLRHRYQLTEALTARTGVEFRYDDIDNVGVSHASGNAQNAIEEGSAAVYGELEWQVTNDLRIRPGLRADYYDFDVSDKNGLSEEGHATDSLLSPKLALAYTLNDTLEFYANWGRGFHSNDARGVVNETDPVEGLAAGTGYETGLRYEHDGLRLTATLWWLNLDSELIFVGDDNSVEAKGGSRREGVEIVAFWQPNDWLAIDAVYAVSDARFTDPDIAGEDHVDGSIEDSGQIGFTLAFGEWDVSTRVRYLGEYALLPNNSERAKSATSVNIRAARAFGDLSVYGEILNATDSDSKDIVYYYSTNVAGLGPDEGRVSRAKEPRSYRMGLRYNF